VVDSWAAAGRGRAGDDARIEAADHRAHHCTDARVEQTTTTPIANNPTGVTSPLLRPLSTFGVRRVRTATTGFSMVAAPRPAWVGANRGYARHPAS
jgi:hypothetical protein